MSSFEGIALLERLNKNRPETTRFEGCLRNEFIHTVPLLYGVYAKPLPVVLDAALRTSMLASN